MHNSSYKGKLIALEAKFLDKDWSRNRRLTELAIELGREMRPHRIWSNKALYRVLAGKSPGRYLEVAIDRLYRRKRPRRVRKDKPRLYVPFSSRRHIKFIESRLTPEQRRKVLLYAASGEAWDGDE